MAFILADRVKETSITSGVGPVVLNGPFGGFQSFSAGIGDGNSTYYAIENEAQWEVGIGTYSAGSNSISRDQVLASSNGNNKITLNGVSIVFCTYAAGRSVYFNDKDLIDLRNHSGILLDRSSILATGTLLHDVRVSGDVVFNPNVNSKVPLTIIRNASGNFIHAYHDDANDRTVGLYTDAQASPTWRLGLKNNPNNVYDPPAYGYVYGKDGVAGLAPNSLNKLELTNTAGLSYIHNNTEVLRLTASTGVYLNSLSSTYPALSLNGGPVMTANIQEWKTYAGTILSVVDSQGRFAINRTSAAYQLDVNGSGRFNTIVFADGTQQSTSASAYINLIGLSGVSVFGSPILNSGTATFVLSDTAVVSGAYGNITNIASFTVDRKGRIVAASNIPINYASGVHTHSASDITNFNSAVSGLLPVKNITAGSGIGVDSVSGDFTVSVTGTFGLTSEEVDDRVSNLLQAGNYISLNYDDNLNALTISSTGLQPSGNYSLVGHTHSASDITNFNTAVSGLVSGIYQPLLSNPVVGIGTSGYVSRWINTNTIGTGIVYDNGTNVGVGTTSPDAPITIGNGTTTGTSGVKIWTTGGSHAFYVASNAAYLQSYNRTYIRNSATDVFDSNGGQSAIANAVPGFPRGLYATPLGAAYKGVVIRGRAAQSEVLTEWQDSAGTALLRVDAAGSISGVASGIFMQQVGIGTAAPTVMLDVRGSAFISGALYDSTNSAGTNGQVLTSTTTGTDWKSLSEITGVDGVGTSGYVARWLDADTVGTGVVYDDGTNIGIGTTTPSYKLSVAGSGEFTSGIYANNIEMPYVMAIGRNLVNKLNVNDLDAPDSKFPLSDTETFGSGVIIIGNQAGVFGRACRSSVAIGNAAMASGIDAPRSVFIGRNAGYKSSGLNLTVGIGNNAFSNAISSPIFQYNVGVGGAVGSNSIDSTFNTFIGGYFTGAYSSGISSSIAIGNSAFGTTNSATLTIGASYSIAIGEGAGAQSKYLNDSIAIGRSAGFMSSGTLNNYIGSSAGSNSQGDYNCYLGTSAGSYCTGNYNIEIRNSGSSLLDGNFSNKLNVNNIIAGDFELKKIAVGNIVSTGNLLPDATLQILPRSTTDIGFIVRGAASQTADLFQVKDSTDTTLLYIDAAGSLSGIGSGVFMQRLGVGTAVPTVTLDVRGSAFISGALYDSTNSAGTNGQVLTSTATGTDWKSLSEIVGVDGVGTSGYVARWIDTDTIGTGLIYDNGANIGIRTTSPSTTLDVRGTGYFSESIRTSGTVVFASGNTGTVGVMQWNNGEGTVQLGLKGGNVNVELAQDNIVLCYNGVGSSLSKGQVVYVSGAQGQRPAINLALANNENTAARTIGFVDETIGIGAEGFVSTFGVITNLDTSAFIEGSGLWLSATTPGAVTMTRPVAPNHSVFLGWCLKSNASSGRILIHVQNGAELEELHDVLIQNLASGHLLQYDSSNGIWRNRTALQAGLVEGVGTSGYVARWTGANVVGTGIVYDNGTNVGIGTTSSSYKFSVNGSGEFTNGIYTNNIEMPYVMAVGRNLTADLNTDTLDTPDNMFGLSDTVANGSGVIVIGDKAAVFASGIRDTIAIGNVALASGSNAPHSVFIGRRAGFKIDRSIGTVAIGTSALGSTKKFEDSSDSNFTTAIGYAAGANSVLSGRSSTFVGSYAGLFIAETYYSSFFGSNAGAYSSGLYNCIGIGNSAFGNNTYSTSSQNLFFSIGIGYLAGAGCKGFTDSIAIGKSSAAAASGNNNIYLGLNAGAYSSGNYNIELSNSGTSLLQYSLLSNKLHVNRLIGGDFESKRLAVGNLTSATNLSPDATLEILPKATTDVGVIIQGVVAQTADFLQVQNSAGTTLLDIDAAGSISGVASGIFGENLRVANIPSGTTETDVVLVKTDGTFVKRQVSSFGFATVEDSIINALIFG